MTKQASTEHREDYLQLNQYKLMGMVGQGSYSIVKMAYNMDEDTHYVRLNNYSIPNTKQLFYTTLQLMFVLTLPLVSTYISLMTKRY